MKGTGKEPEQKKILLCNHENDCCKYPGCLENDCTGFEPVKPKSDEGVEEILKNAIISVIRYCDQNKKEKIDEETALRNIRGEFILFKQQLRQSIAREVVGEVEKLLDSMIYQSEDELEYAEWNSMIKSVKQKLSEVVK